MADKTFLVPTLAADKKVPEKYIPQSILDRIAALEAWVAAHSN